jgi:hypothetical protein
MGKPDPKDRQERVRTTNRERGETESRNTHETREVRLDSPLEIPIRASKFGACCTGDFCTFI